MKKSPMTIDPETGLHILRGYISYDGQDCCQIAIYCPFCRCNHYHGWPSRDTDPNRLEHRICHCHGTPCRSHRDSPFHAHGYLIGVDLQKTKNKGLKDPKEI